MLSVGGVVRSVIYDRLIQQNTICTVWERSTISFSQSQCVEVELVETTELEADLELLEFDQVLVWSHRYQGRYRQVGLRWL